jgi:hypothetical protein
MLSSRRLIAGFVFVVSGISCRAGVFYSRASQDAEIEPAKRTAVDSAAMSLARTLLGTNPGSALKLMTPDGASHSSEEKIALLAARMIQPYSPTGLSVDHTYLVNYHGDSPSRVICAENLKKPDGWVSLAALDVPEQAHVLLSANCRNNRLSFEVWLVPAQEGWAVQDFWLNFSTLGDLDSVKLWEVAGEQLRDGNQFNALLLNVAAEGTVARGPDLQLGISQAIAEQRSSIQVPPEVKGRPPFEWRQNDATFRVLAVSPISIGGKLYITLVHEVPHWNSNTDAETANRRLISYFKSRFPEYSKVFAGVVARAKEAGSNRIFGTVDAPAEKA